MTQAQSPPPEIVTLLTDFGGGDGFVAAMKGVLLGINPGLTVVDVSHDTPPQDIAHAAFVLGTTYRYFPPASLHVAVVDPGVGTSRRAVLLTTPSGMFLAPDNGLLTYVLMDHNPSPAPQRAGFLNPFAAGVPDGCSAYSLTDPQYWRPPVSNTFHGRDVFAPVAAHLSLGVPPDRVGGPARELTLLNLGTSVDGMGKAVFIDRFGNIVSNIRGADLPGEAVRVVIKGRSVGGLARTYAESGGLAALIGSHGYLEIAERDGSAARTLGAVVGDDVRVSTP